LRRKQLLNKTTDSAKSNDDFLIGGGEMGERMRALDWSQTPLGAASGWPQSLKTIVRVMLDSRYAMWMLWGPQFTFFCNDAYLPTVGIKRDWVLGARADKVWEEIWPEIGPRIEHVLDEGRATWDEALLLFLERSGYPEETYHTFSYSPVYDDANSIAGMLCVVTEVTDRVISERRLAVLRDLAQWPRAETSHEACQQLLSTLKNDPLDVPFAVLYSLAPEQDHLRLTHRYGDVPERLLPAHYPLLNPSLPWPIAAALRSNEPQIAALPSGADAVASPLWPDRISHAMVLPVKHGGANSAAVLIAGVSPRRPLDDAYRGFLDLVARQFAAAIADAQTYEAERRRAEALAEIDRAKTVFFSNVSHEFRTPLTLMLGPIGDILGDAATPAPIRAQLELAHRNSLRLLKLVNSLLEFSRFEAGRVQAAFEPVDLSVLTGDLAGAFRSAVAKAGIRFEVNCAPLPEPVYVDADLWEQVILNLLSNAFKFTFEGQISVRLRAEAGGAVLEVSDTGVGVPSHEIPRLFERFHRVEGTVGRTHEGSGIGLALVHEIVKLHGGRIEVQSELKRGTTFLVHIPFGHAHLPADRVRPRRDGRPAGPNAEVFQRQVNSWLPEPESAAGGAPSEGLTEGTALRYGHRFASTFGARLVLADDNADMRDYVSRLLAPHYRVESVSDGEQALAAVRRERPELILSDVMMPRLDGFGLLKALRREEPLRDIPLILLSARAGEESRIEGLDSGADDYLIKPFTPRELLARVGALIELTRLRAESERLRTEQFETLLNKAPLGMYVVDADFRIREVNPVARPVFGDIPDLIGRDFGEVMRIMWKPAAADETIRMFRHTLETGESHWIPECSEPRLDTGVADSYEWMVHRIPLAEGRHGVVCYFRDISVHVRARQQLQQADRQKDEFLAMLAHELRNPLAPIYSASELLSRTVPEQPIVQSAIATIKRQTTQLTRLVDDLLDVSRITQGRIELKRVTLDLSTLVAQALETVDPLMREKRHQVSVTQSYRPLYVSGDFVRLVQCIVNLLTNAAKYSDAGGRIRIETRSEADMAHIIVADSGVGMSAELLPRVFDLFVQSERTLDRSLGGLGIGLSVVKRLVEMHGGHVSATSAGVGQGSTFEISLPLVAAPTHAARPVEQPQVAPKRVFIVDDNVDAADMLALTLQLDGHEVQAVHTPAEALHHIESFRPDVALVDIGLPEMDGYELVQRLKRQPRLATVKFVALTGYGQVEDRRRVRDAGFNAHLVKPVNMQELTRTLSD
jgi:PAS domain S-box-containing protein